MRDVSLVQVRTPVTQRDSGVGEWWVYERSGRYSLLRLPSCRVIDAGLPMPTVQPGGRVDFTLGLQYSVPGGAAIFDRYDMNVQRRSWWVLADPMSPLVPAPEMTTIEAMPILSNAADAIGWLERVAGSGPPILERVVIRPIDQSSRSGDLRIELAPFGPASYVLMEVNTATLEVVLWRDQAPLVLGFGGSKRDVPYTPGSVRPLYTTYLQHRDGWVAWDAYREDGAYQLAWSLEGRSGVHRATKGRSITSATVDPSGHFIAISETTTLSIGDAPDVVYVIRTIDGADVFRKYIARYSRSQVVFFEGGLFAYSELEGTHVLRVQNEASTP